MTKKDYVLIAGLINDFVMTSVDNNKRISTGHACNLVDIFALKLGMENERFDVSKFKQACLKNPNFS